MKFKKTKLTALAMSVLMAMSTITSVTWAADLFTDGTEDVTEVVVHAPVVEDTVTEEADKTQLLGESFVVDYPVVVQSQDPDAERVDGSTGVYDEDGLWVLYYKYMDKTGNVQNTVKRYVLKEGDYTYTKATCVKRKTITLHLTLNDSNIPESARKVAGTAIEFGTIDPDAHGYAVTMTVPVLQGDSEKSCVNGLSNDGMKNDTYKYETYSYVGCKDCMRVYDSASGEFRDYTPHGENGLPSFGDNLDIVKDFGVEKNTSYAQHSLGDWKYGEIPFDDSDDVDVNNFGMLKTRWEIFDAARNARVTDNKLDVYDRTKPALVRRWKECSRCGRIEPQATDDDYYGQWYLFWTGEKVETDIFYMYDSRALSNIEGFVYVGNGENNIPELRVDDLNPYVEEFSEGVYYIPAERFMGVALKNCNLGGTYYKCHFINDYIGEYVIDEEISIPPQSHAYGSVYVDVSKADTQIDYLVKDETYGSNGIKVTRDASGNVTGAYSNDCTREAKYVLSHNCLSCGKKEVVNTLTTAKGDHKFSNWLVDEAKTVYTMIDSSLHLVHYMDSRVCTVCGKVETRDSQKKPDVKESHGNLKEKKIDDGLGVEATCGTVGSYSSGRGCAKCDYVIEETITTVVIPATDKHDFGTNEPYLRWVGEVQIGPNYNGNNAYNVVAQIVRDCTVCGIADSNGIGGAKVGNVVGGEVVSGKVDIANMIPAKKNPATGVAYSCSVAQVPIVVEWKGYVDGVVKEFTETKVVPYYDTLAAYSGRTAHIPGSVKIENRIEPTAEKDGSYDEVIYCTVCGDEYSRKTVTIPKDVEISIPTVTAKAVNYNTINVSWTSVEGASSYRLYYKSAALGINTWKLVKNVNGTSFTHSGLVTNVKYRYTVRAVVDGKYGEFSKTGSVASPKLNAPVLNSVTSVAKGKKLSWSKVEGASGYIIQRDGKRVATVKGGAKVTWTDKKAASDSTYKVRAYRTVESANISKNNVYSPYSEAK